MFSREEIRQMPEYWIERIQNDLYAELRAYMAKNKLNQTQLAEKLGFSKGYISQVMHGRFNHSYQKLVELALAIGKEPEFKFRDRDIADDYVTDPGSSGNMKIVWKNLADRRRKSLTVHDPVSFDNRIAL
jgi:transcriptional regulator with XRE-family HTH domain